MKEKASQFAPANIALIKYWGKRQSPLNLPVTSSLSVSLPLGTHTTLSLTSDKDMIFLNGNEQSPESSFAMRLSAFLDPFRPPNTYFRVDTKNEIPTSAGLASSSSGFAALVLALNDLFEWNLSQKELSILARQGSGSACRSIYKGFVEWHKGVQDDGKDSYAEPVPSQMQDLCIGLWMVSDKEKPIDSRRAMIQTVETSPLYAAWPDTVASDLAQMKKALSENDFLLLGKVAEENALAMHATMMAAKPAILYWLPESVAALHKIWSLRKEGLNLFFTMDAGPNLKLLFLKKDAATVKSLLPNLQLLDVVAKPQHPNLLPN